jgi:uncharacterized protein YdiU (UPF0061 family)
VPKLESLQFTNPYLTLSKESFALHHIEALKNPQLISANKSVFELLELDFEESKRSDFINLITGQKRLNNVTPFAMCYAGHQFGHFVPRLGDGRALMLGQVETSSKKHFDIQIKGGGPTLYSRNADGRAVLRSSIREYLCSEAMFSLGIQTTRSLCLIASESDVYRESIETGAMLLRVAPSHIRFGSFEYYYHSGKLDNLKELTDFTIEHYFKELKQTSNPYLALLSDAIESTALMIAQWQAVGFAHGVMNTDNMSIHGLTLDYGPFGFLDEYDPSYICNHSDHQGRYAFNQQPEIGQFNLSCLAQALLPLLDNQPEKGAEKATALLKAYPDIYINHYATLMREKLGLKTAKKEDRELIRELLDLMEANQVDYNIFFRTFSQINQKTVRNLFIDRQGVDTWMGKYELRLTSENLSAKERSIFMLSKNPKYILRNYIAQTVIKKAEAGDFSELNSVLTLLQSPFDEHDAFEHYAGFPPDWSKKISISCSS